MPDLLTAFHAFSEPIRLRLLAALAEQPKNVGALAEEGGTSLPTTTHHLGLLRMMGLVSSERKGQEVHYRLAKGVKASKAKGATTLEVQCDDGTLRVVTRG